MVTIDITRDALLVSDRGRDCDLSFRGQLEVPLSNVAGVAFDPEAAQRVLAAYHQPSRPAKVATTGEAFVGTLSEHGDCIIWDVQQASRSIIIELDHDRYAKIIVEVPDAEATAARLRGALNQQRGAAVHSRPIP
jgi:hypothetical protein